MLATIINELISKYNLNEINNELINKLIIILDKFGYIKKDGIIELWEIENAIKMAQKFLGIIEDGFGPRTIKALLTSVRCGCADLQEGVEKNLGPGYWGLKTLTYAWDNYVDGLSKEQQHNLASKALKNIELFCNLKFQKIDATSNANLVITASNNKRDGLGQEGNVLAYQFLPPEPNFTGQLVGVFDLAETWIDNQNARGIYYLSVFAHEICGHGLGLQHTSTPNQLLNPYYNVNIYEPQQEDKKYLIQLYGPPKNNPGPPNPPHNPNPNPNPSPIPGKTSLVIDWDKRTLSAEGFRISKIGN